MTFDIPVRLATSGIYSRIPGGYALPVSLASNIRAFRRAANLNQTQLGERIGVKQGAVSKWESGESQPDAADLPRIAVAVKVPLDVLMQGVDDQYDSWRDLPGQGPKVQRTPHQGGESDGTQHADRVDRTVRDLQEENSAYRAIVSSVERAAKALTKGTEKLAAALAAARKMREAGATQSKARRRHRRTG